MIASSSATRESEPEHRSTNNPAHPQRGLIAQWSRPLAMLAIVCTFLAISAWLFRPWWEMALRSDGSPASWLSSALLITGAVLALRLARDGSLPAGFSTITAIALFALALDEQFMFHERIKHGQLTPGSLWGDANVWLLLAAAPLFAYLFRRHVAAPLPRSLMTLALAVAIFALAIDILPMHGLASIKIFEEAFEVLAETLFVTALLETPSPRLHVQSASSP